MRHWIRIGAVVAVSALAPIAAWPSPASAQAKVPSRPVQFIVPWAAGGGTDRIARMVAVLLEKDLGQPVTVVNRTGGGGMLGHTAGATAAPDGHTITIVDITLAMLHWTELTPLREIPTYRDFTPVAPPSVTLNAPQPWPCRPGSETSGPTRRPLTCPWVDPGASSKCTAAPCGWSPAWGGDRPSGLGFRSGWSDTRGRYEQADFGDRGS